MVTAGDALEQYMHVFKVIRILDASDTLKTIPDYIANRKKRIDCFLESKAFNLAGFRIPI